MDIQEIVKQLNKLDKNILNLQKCVVRFYIQHNKIKHVESSKVLESYCFSVEDKLFAKVEKVLHKQLISEDLLKFSIDDLVNIYELLIPSDEKKENGMVFTPLFIKEFIIKNLLSECNKKKIKQLKIVDPSCGCGSFLITMAKLLNKQYGIEYEHIYNNMIFGVDISENNINKTKILLELLALENEEILKEVKYNLKVGDSLEFRFEEVFSEVFIKNGGFDLVIGNPPYVRTKKLSEQVKINMNKWFVAQIGNADLYLPFYEIGIKILSPDGRLGYISINTFLTSLNGRNLRHYLSELKAELTVINFRDIQIFKGVTSYTCIVFIDRSKINDKVKYNIADNVANFSTQNFSELKYADLDNDKGWNLAEPEILNNIKNMERFNTKLERYGVKNGIATLKNDIYIFKAYSEDNQYIYFINKDGEKEKIEKEICVKIAKPNVIKDEKELVEKMEYIIFPYRKGKDSKYTLIGQEEFENQYPNAYKYLSKYRNELEQRDNGKAKDKYLKWYAFGRTQGMYNQGNKLLIPYMANQPIAVISEDKEVLLYCGYALFSEDIEELNLIKKILLTNIFWYYIKHTSKCYSGGYMSLAKSYIKDFSIPDLTLDQKKAIIEAKTVKEVEKILVPIYKIKNIGNEVH